VNVPDEQDRQFAELIKVAEQAEIEYARSRKPDGGGYTRPTYAQFARIIASIRDRHEQMVDDWPPDVLADEQRVRQKIAEEVRHLASEHCGDESIEGNDTPTAYWLADKIEAGGSDAAK
jgi:hypothetical protein